MDGARPAGMTIDGEGHPAGAREGREPWAPWALALSTLAHAALLGLLIAPSETTPVTVPATISVDLVPGSGAEAAGQAGGGPQGGGEEAAEPTPAPQTAVPDPAPDPEPPTAEAVALPDPSPTDSPASELPVPENADKPVATPPVPARKPAVKPATAVTRAPPSAAPARASPSRTATVGEQDGDATPGPSDGTANGSALAEPGAGAGVGSGGADAMRAYLEEVRRRLQARLAVPAEARRLRLGGTVLVRFTVERDGSVPGDSMAVLSETGVAVLERAALETVARTAPFPPPPRPATVEVPVQFSVSVR